MAILRIFLTSKIYSILAEEEEGGVSIAPPSVIKQAELLRAAPFVFPFKERVQFFTRLVASNRTTTQGRLQDFLVGPSIHVTARRDHIYEDAFSELAHGQGMRQKSITSRLLSQPTLIL